jgi:hypothetical protein
MGLFRRWSILLAVAIGVPAQAADPDSYAGVMVGIASYDEGGYSFNISTVTGRLGYQMTRALAVEARLAAGGSGDSGGASYRLDGLGSVLAKLSWQPFSDSEAYVHLLLGATAARTTSSTTGASRSNNLHGGSYGIGIDLFADRNRALNLEWIQYLQGDISGTSPTAKYKLSNFGIGYLQRF